MAQYNDSGVFSGTSALRGAMSDSGLAEGTIVYTMDGALPVEYLTPGDRIITRSGAQVLTGLDVDGGAFRLRFKRPQIVYADGIEIRAA